MQYPGHCCFQRRPIFIITANTFYTPGKRRNWPSSQIITTTANFHVLFLPILTSWGDEEDSSGSGRSSIGDSCSDPINVHREPGVYQQPGSIIHVYFARLEFCNDFIGQCAQSLLSSALFSFGFGMGAFLIWILDNIFLPFSFIPYLKCSLKLRKLVMSEFVMGAM